MRRRPHVPTRRGRRNSRRQRWLAAVFALIFAPAFGAGARRAAAECLPFVELPRIAVESAAPWSVTTADLDGDGDDDAVVSSYVGDRVHWFENDGAGGGWARATVAELDGAIHAAAADLDGDGDLDLGVAGYVADTVVWIENVAGDASAWSAHTVAANQLGARAVVAADLDGDGDLDLAAALYGGGFDWYENSAGDGSSWSAQAVAAASQPYSIAAADLDGDGDLDLAGAALGGDRVDWYENLPPGDGSSWTTHTVATLDGASAVAAGDFDADGDLDLAAGALGAGAVVRYVNDGGTDAWAAETVSTAGGAHSLAALDLDRDGDLDLAAAGAGLGSDPTATWYENLGAAWRAHDYLSNAANASGVAAADLDRDGDPDLLTVLRTSAEWVLHDDDTLHGEALFAPAVNIVSFSDVTSADFADIDGDGDLDIFVTFHFTKDVAWYENLAPGDGSSWSFHTIAPVSTAYMDSVFSADVDGDGDADAVTTGDYLSTPVEWFENANGLGTSWIRRSIQLGAGTLYHAPMASAGDIDGDGDLDILPVHDTADSLLWRENLNGVGSSWGDLLVADFYLARAARPADVNGDGVLDVLSATSDYPVGIYWHENRPPGDGSVWSLHALSTANISPVSILPADVDDDGDTDALVGSGVDKLTWYENRPPGDGSVWSLHSISTVESPSRLAVADIDGDGDLDVLSGSNAWYENDGIGTVWTRHTFAPSGANSIAAADLDGDGDFDALSASPGDDRVAWFENLGTKVFAHGFGSETSESANLACWSNAVP